MIEPTTPPRLKKGDTIRVIAPALSMSIIGKDTRQYARTVFEEQFGLRVTFGKHVEEEDAFGSSSVRSRVEDLHEAFSDPDVQGIITIIGGFNSNQMLDHINWDIIKNNPKVFCGYSDTTVLQNAILAKTGLITYSGPHYSTFGQKHLDPYTVAHFKTCLFDTKPFDVQASETWSDDAWFLDQDNRTLLANDGHWALQPGEAEGTIIGGNLCSLNLLQGTAFMPSAGETILFIEDDSETYIKSFDRDLQSLLQTDYFTRITGIVIGRFQKGSDISRSTLQSMLQAKPELKNIPIIANVNFGHTSPIATFPIGGRAQIAVSGDNGTITIL